MKLKELINKLDEPKIIVHRTVESTVFEIVTAALNIVLLIVGFVLYSKGRVDMGMVMLAAATCIVSSVVMLWSSYHSENISVPCRIKNMRQWKTAILMTRVNAVEIPLLMGPAILFCYTEWVAWVCVAGLLLTDIGFTVFIYLLR